MKIFNLTNGDVIVCNNANTRNGFKHVATLLRKGSEIYETKICYLNRTWERFEYESVINKLLEDFFGDELKNPTLNIKLKE